MNVNGATVDKSHPELIYGTCSDPVAMNIWTHLIYLVLGSAPLVPVVKEVVSLAKGLAGLSLIRHEKSSITNPFQNLCVQQYLYFLTRTSETLQCDQLKMS